MELAKIKKAVRSLDFEEGREDFDAAVMLLASAQVGPNVKRVAQFCGFPQKWVAEKAKLLRDNGVRCGGHVCCDWTDKKSGGIAFFCDVLIAMGMLERAKEG